MNILRTSWKRVVTLLAATILLVVSAPAVASADESAYFALSRSSGQAGLSVTASQIDPCPAVSGQFLRFEFTDSDGTTSATAPSVPVTSAGNWQYDRKVPIGEVQGEGYVTVQCRLPNQSEPTLEYESVPYTVTGSMSEFEISQKSYMPGDDLRIDSITPCPANTDYVWAQVWNVESGPAIYPDATLNETTGVWEIEYALPEQGMQTGVHTASIRCVGDDDLQYGMSYFHVGPLPEYVALGDSYSAGLGTFNYDSSSGGCYRSDDSYAYYVAERSFYSQPLFAACSGAQTDDFYNANPNNLGESPQLSNLSEDTKLVTLTIGGNDAGFAGAMEECVHYPGNQGWGCWNDSALVTRVEEHLDALNDGTPDVTDDFRQIAPLQQVYESVHDSAPNAKIFVAGYPKLFGSDVENYVENTASPSESVCTLTMAATVDYADAMWMNDQAEVLNDIISTAVDNAYDDGIDIAYVPPDLFDGHGLCDDQEEWINPVVTDGSFPTPNPSPESLHPNVTGQQAGYGAAFMSVMDQYQY